MSYYKFIFIFSSFKITTTPKKIISSCFHSLIVIKATLIVFSNTIGNFLFLNYDVATLSRETLFKFQTIFLILITPLAMCDSYPQMSLFVRFEII